MKKTQSSQRLSRLRTQHGGCEDEGSFPDLAQWVKDLELPADVARIQRCDVGQQLGSILTPSLGTSIHCRCWRKEGRKKEGGKKEKKEQK